LRQADRAGVRVLARPNDLEDRNHGEGHVGRSIVRSVGAEAQIDVDEGSGVALEPAWLESDSTTGYGPLGAVGCCWHAAAWIHPLHAIGEGIVGNQIISSPSRVCDDTVRIHQSQQTYRGNCCSYP